MNPLAAVEAMAGTRGPLVTLQALAEAVAAVAPPQSGGPAQQAAAAAADEAAAAGMPGAADLPAATMTLPAPASTAQALQGRITLGQMAAEAQVTLRPAAEAAPAEIPRAAQRGAESAADGGAAPRAADTLMQPVMVTPLNAPPLQPARRREPPSPSRRPLPEVEGDETPPDPEQQADEPPAGDEPVLAEAPAPQAQALLALLQAEGPADARSELARGRRVLVVLPQGGSTCGQVPAQAWLLSGARALRFHARWWPGAGPVATGGWLLWRVFRDGDPLLTRGLRSRGGGTTCRLLLGTPAQRLVDADAAALELTERIRFVQALGGQWSLLVAVAPPGAGT